MVLIGKTLKKMVCQKMAPAPCHMQVHFRQKSQCTVLWLYLAWPQGLCDVIVIHLKPNLRYYTLY